MTGSRLRINRLAVRYVIPRAHPDEAALVARLDAAARALPDRLAAYLAPRADDASDIVWLLRGLAVDLSLDAGIPSDDLAVHWAGAIARALLRRLDTGADGVLMFPDRVAYLASFLCDLAGGEAWSFWYYAPFEGLRALPLPAALRTALLAEPQEGRQAVLRLEQWQAIRVIAALGSNESARVLAGLATESAECPPPSAVLAAWEDAPAFGLCPARLALGFWRAIAQAAPGACGMEAAELAKGLAALRLAMARGPRGMGALLEKGDLPGLYRLLGPAEAEPLAPLLRLSEEVRHAMAAPPATGQTTSPAVRATPFGGLFLLLADLETLSRGGSPFLLPAFLVLAACAGEEAEAVFLDPLWRDLFAVPGDLLLADLPEAAFAKNLGHAEAVLARFAARLPGFAASSPAYLRRNFLAAGARVSFTPDLITVTLGRPPLDLVLGLAGLGRGQIHLPWLDARPLALRRDG